MVLKSDRKIFAKLKRVDNHLGFVNFIQLKSAAMPTSINKSTNFAEQPFYIGIDVHKKSWTITVRTLDLEVGHFTQMPDARLLARHLHNRYPGGNFFSAYEAGFCGTSPHHSLCNAGIQNIIIHPADLPQTDKHRKNKTDLHDSRAIARYLEAGVLSCIHIMPADQQQRRALYRCREAKVKDVTRCSNRLRSLLNYSGIVLPEVFRDKEYINQNFLSWISRLELITPEGTDTIRQYVEELKYQREQLLQITRKLKKSISLHFKESYSSLLSVPGIGPIVAMAILSETGDLNRFKSPDEFCSYLGLVPGEQSSGETIYCMRIQPRCNTHLRPLLIEAAWTAIRRCPVLLAYYKKHVGKNNKKAIVKVARKLALIAKSVALKKTSYQTGYQNKNLLMTV
jgi:transposase